MKGRELERLDRDNEIWKMRLAGFTLEEIGKEYGVTAQRIHQILKGRFAAMPINHIDEWRILQVAQIEVGIRALWDRYERGEHTAVQDMKALLSEKARVLGLYKNEISTAVNGDFFDDWDKAFAATGNPRVIDGEL